MKDEPWPEWIVAAGDDMRRALAVTASIHSRLTAIARDGYLHTRLAQAQVNPVLDDLVSKGLIAKDASGKIQPAFTRPEWKTLPTHAVRQMVYNNASAYQILGALLASNRLAVVRLLDAFRGRLADGDILVPLMCVRGLFEHVGHLHATVRWLAARTYPQSFEGANDALGTTYEELAKRMYATTVNWLALLRDGESARNRKKRDIKYSPPENRVNVSAQQVLDSVDALDRAVPRTRACYEVLCEFAHPNVGALFASTETTTPVADQDGILWVKKQLGIGPPASFVADGREVASWLVGQLSEVLEHYEKILIEGEHERARVLGCTQRVVRAILARQRDLIEPYALCPCGSGEKMKFCCRA